VSGIISRPEPDDEALVCAQDDIKIDPRTPRCPHPTSQCRFRELCPVRDAIKEIEKGGGQAI
jgi:hypothetical protein